MEPAVSDTDVGRRGKGRRGGHATRVDTGWAWVVMAAFLVTCFLRVGYFKSFGIIFVELLRTYNNSVAVTSVVVGFIAVGFSVGGFLTITVFMPTMSIRKCVILGGLVMFAGVILTITSSNMAAVVVTQGFLVGFGHVVLYLPGQTLLALYFRKWHALAIHVVNVGAGFGAVAFPPLFHFLIETYGLDGCLLIVSGILLNAVVCGALMRPPGLKDDVCIEEALLEEHMEEEEILGCDVLIGERPEESKPNGTTTSNGFLAKRRKSQTAIVLQEIEKDVRNLEPILEKVSQCDPVIPMQEHYSAVPSSPFDGLTTVNVAPICSIGEVKRNDSAPTIGNATDKEVDPRKGFFSDFLDSEAVVNISKMKFEMGVDDEDDDVADGSNEGAKIAPIPSTSAAPSLPPSIVVEDVDAPTASGANVLTPLLIPDKDAINMLDGMAQDMVPLTPKSIKSEPVGTQIAALCILADPSLPVTSLASAAGHRMMFHGSAPALGRAAFEVVDVVDTTVMLTAPGQAPKKQQDGCWDKITSKQNFDASLFREPLLYVHLTQAFLALLPTNLMLNFLPALAWERGLTDLQHALLLILVAVSSIVSKLATGLLLEHRKVRPSSVQAVSILVMGVAGVLVPLCTRFWMFLIFATGFGLVADVYYGLVALLAEEFFGAERLDHVILLTILFEGVFLAVGAPLCGLIRDCTGSFDNVYHCLGGFALLAGLVLILQRCAPWKTARQIAHSDANGKATPSHV